MSKSKVYCGTCSKIGDSFGYYLGEIETEEEKTTLIANHNLSVHPEASVETIIKPQQEYVSNYDTHKKLLDSMRLNPEKFEDGLTVLSSELAIGRIRIDILARDKAGNICFLDTTSGNMRIKTEQLLAYRKEFVRVIAILFPNMKAPAIRLIAFNKDQIVEISS